MTLPEPDDISTQIPVKARITVREGVHAGQVFDDIPLPCVVGRSKQAAVQIPDDPQQPTMSRRHVVLSLRGGRLAIQDLSTNGTRLGTTLMAPGETVTVSDQTPIWLGHSTMITVDVLWPEAQPRVGNTVQGTLTLRILGPPSALVNDVPVPPDAWQTRKALALLAYLAMREGTPQDQQRLCETLWPESEGAARATLQSTISRLRRALRLTAPQAPDPIVLVRNLYCLSSQLEVSTDARQFEDLCSQANFEAAVRLYRGPFMDGYDEEWIELLRVRLQRMYLDALDRLARTARPDAAMGHYRSMLACDPCSEAGHVGLMRCLVAAGQRDEAVRQYAECTRLLKKHLDLPPSAELTGLYRNLLQTP